MAAARQYQRSIVGVMDVPGLRAHCLDLMRLVDALTPGQLQRLAADANADIDLALLAFDSLTLLDFCLRLEDRIGIEVEPADVVAVSTLNEFIGNLTQRALHRG